MKFLRIFRGKAENWLESCLRKTLTSAKKFSSELCKCPSGKIKKTRIQRFIRIRIPPPGEAILGFQHLFKPH